MIKRYHLVHYTSTPQVGFTCDYQKVICIKVTHYHNRIFYPSVRMAIHTIGEGSLHIFEFGRMRFWNTKEIKNAARRYKNLNI